MRFVKVQQCLIALVTLSFLVLMFIAIGFISEQPILSNPFRYNYIPSANDISNLKQKQLAYSSSEVKLVQLPGPFSSDNLVKPKNRHRLENISKASSESNVNSLMKTCMESAEENSNNFPIPNYSVHVFYYPWYGNLAVDGRYLHWNHRILPHWKPEVSERYPKGRHVPPNDIGASFYPRLGPYSSKDLAVIDDHMRQIRSSGAGVLSVSWYPPGEADDEGLNVDSVIPHLLEAADRYSLKICLHIEPFKNRNDITLRESLEYIIDQYGNHSAFYRWPSSNLPVYYIYDSYKMPDYMWSSLLSADSATSVRQTALDGIFLGLAVERMHIDQLIHCGFDGFYTYFATDGFTYGSSARNWDHLAKLANQHRVLFVPSVGPGYDDTPIRPWNAANTRDRSRGLYYERSLAAAIKVHSSAISITSFNEWGEGTQIEEAVPKTTANRTYVDYQPHGANYYLQLTRKWVCRFTHQNLWNA